MDGVCASGCRKEELSVDRQGQSERWRFGTSCGDAGGNAATVAIAAMVVNVNVVVVVADTRRMQCNAGAGL